MARTADSEARRREVCDATWRVIVRDGLESASLRAIAFELGMTTGILMHYFKDKDALLLFAIDQVMNRLAQRIDTLLEGEVGLARLETIILASLPLEPKSQVGWKVWLAYAGASVGQEHLLAEHQKRYDANRERLSTELRALRTAKIVRKDLELREAVDEVVELVDGIGMGWLVTPAHYGEQRQRARVRRYLASIKL